MSRIEDYLTQVQNPNEKKEESSSESRHSDGPSAPPEKERPSSSFFCCGAGKKDNKSTKTVAAPAAAPQPAATRPAGRVSVSIPKVGAPGIALPTPAPAEDDGLPRDLINSPRNGGGPKATAPFRDDALLPPLSPRLTGRKCLVLDLDETLVHSSFKPVDRCDFIVPVEIEGRVHQVYVAKRPFVDDFMKRMGELYEVVVFTASLSKYADPVLDLLDVHKVVDHRLFRESCSCFKGSYVKDMGRMGRELTQIMILDNSPHSYAFNPENAVPCESWFNDYEDTELRELIGVFEQLADPAVTDVMAALEKMKISAPVSLSTDESDSYSESDEETGSGDDEDADDSE